MSIGRVCFFSNKNYSLLRSTLPVSESIFPSTMMRMFLWDFCISRVFPCWCSDTWSAFCNVVISWDDTSFQKVYPIKKLQMIQKRVIKKREILFIEQDGDLFR